MIVIAHRINTISGLREINPGYGVEVDVRAHGDRLVLAHEPHVNGDELKDFLSLYKNAFIIFNIKEAGIEKEVIALAKLKGLVDYFLLDVEYPFIHDSVTKKEERKIAVRMSEAEPIGLALNHARQLDWVWLDTFSRIPVDGKSYRELRAAGFRLCLCCPSCLGRPSEIPAYQEYLKSQGIRLDAVMTEKEHLEQWSSFSG